VLGIRKLISVFVVSCSKPVKSNLDLQILLYYIPIYNYHFHVVYSRFGPKILYLFSIEIRLPHT
jgi:hypothetical protein